MEQALRGLTPLAAAAVGEVGRPSSAPLARFTALELAAAEQLIHLSESSCSSGGAAFSTPRGGGSAASVSSSSPRSVNAPAAAPVAPARDVVVVVEEDDDEQEVGGRSRRNRRYRSISEIYDATEPAGARRRKDNAGAREERRK